MGYEAHRSHRTFTWTDLDVARPLEVSQCLRVRRCACPLYGKVAAQSQHQSWRCRSAAGATWRIDTLIVADGPWAESEVLNGARVDWLARMALNCRYNRGPLHDVFMLGRLELLRGKRAVTRCSSVLVRGGLSCYQSLFRAYFFSDHRSEGSRGRCGEDQSFLVKQIQRHPDRFGGSPHCRQCNRTMQQTTWNDVSGSWDAGDRFDQVDLPKGALARSAHESATCLLRLNQRNTVAMRAHQATQWQLLPRR